MCRRSRDLPWWAPFLGHLPRRGAAMYSDVVICIATRGSGGRPCDDSPHVRATSIVPGKLPVSGGLKPSGRRLSPQQIVAAGTTLFSASRNRFSGTIDGRIDGILLFHAGNASQSFGRCRQHRILPCPAVVGWATASISYADHQNVLSLESTGTDGHWCFGRCL